MTPQTKVILPVHFAGRPCEMDPLLEVAERHGLRVVEDVVRFVLDDARLTAVAASDMKPSKRTSGQSR